MEGGGDGGGCGGEDPRALLSSLQEVLGQVERLERSQQGAARALRDKHASLERSLLRVLRLEGLLRALTDASDPPPPSAAAAGDPEASAPSPSGSPALPSAASPEPPPFASRPFGYSHEVGYARLLKACRAHPAALGRRLARAGAARAVPRSDLRRVARAVVWDLFGAARERELLELLACVLPHTEHGSLGAHLVAEYLALVGQRYLECTLSPTVERILTDDRLQLDLMQHAASPMPSPSGPQTPSNAAGDAQDEVEPEAEAEAAAPAPEPRPKPPPPSTPPPPLPSGEAPPPPPQQPAEPEEPSSPSPASPPPPRLEVTPPEGEASAPSETSETSAGQTDLFDVCGQLLRAVLSSLSVLPYGVRFLASRLAGASSPPSAAAPERHRLQGGAVSDFLFLNWVVNAVIFPERHGLAGHRPVSQLARRNLQVVGTVLIKLVSGSRFTAYQAPLLGSLNSFLDDVEPRMARFVRVASRATPLERHFGGAAAADEDSVPGPVSPLAMLPNSLFALHRALVEGKGGDDDGAEACALAEPLGRLATVPPTVPPEQDSYLLVDLGLPPLELPAEEPDASDGGGDILRALLRAIGPLSACGLPDTDADADADAEAEAEADAGAAPAGVLELLRREGRRTLMLGDVARGALVDDLVLRLEATGVPAERVARRLLAAQRRRLGLLLDGGLARRVIMAQGAVEAFMESLRRRERACSDVFTSLQVRRLLAVTLPKVRALRKYLDKRNADPERAESLECGGLCPVSLEADRFLCHRCEERLKVNLRTVVSFLNKYAVDRGAPFPPQAAALGPELDLRNPGVVARVMDFVVAACYPQLMVVCRTADETFGQLLQHLALRYPTLGAFCRADDNGGGGGGGAGGNDDDDEEDASAGDDAGPLSAAALNQAVLELSRVSRAASPRAKLEAFVRCRSVVSTVLQGGPGGAARGADDYMPVLSYAILVANPAAFVSSVQFVQTLHRDSLSQKGFVDTLVAIKYLMGLRGADLPPRLARFASSSRLLADDEARQEFLDSTAARQLRLQMSQMGFGRRDVDTGLATLAASLTRSELQHDMGFSRLLDFLTDLTCLREMGFGRDLSVRALVASGHNVSRAVQYIQANRGADGDGDGDGAGGGGQAGAGPSSSSSPPP